MIWQSERERKGFHLCHFEGHGADLGCGTGTLLAAFHIFEEHVAGFVSSPESFVVFHTRSSSPACLFSRALCGHQL